MKKKHLAIVTDSTSDIPVEVQKKLGIEVVPLNVIFGDVNYKDGRDITSQDFFEMLPKSAVHPRTSQPSPGDFRSVYEGLLKEYEEILSIHISSSLSGTYQSAVIAAEMLECAKITILDSRTASMGLGLAVVAAAEARNAGKSREEAAAIAERICKQQVLLMTVETLEYLQRNGRIGKASALLGSLLNVHPILRMGEGVITPHSKVRGKMSKVLRDMVDSAGDFVPHGTRVRASIMHGNCSERAKELEKLLNDCYKVDSLIMGEIGSVIGVHMGPGAVGLIVVPC